MNTAVMPRVTPVNLEQIRADLAELCRSHDLDAALAERCESLDGLIDLVLADFEERVDEIVETAELQRRLRSLLQFACEVGTLAAGVQGQLATTGANPAEGVLARYETLATLCHKINNPLTSLLGRAQMLQLKQGNDPAASKAVGVVHESGKRIAGLIQQMAREICAGRDDLR